MRISQPYSHESDRSARIVAEKRPSLRYDFRWQFFAPGQLPAISAGVWGSASAHAQSWHINNLCTVHYLCSQPTHLAFTIVTNRKKCSTNYDLTRSPTLYGLLLPIPFRVPPNPSTGNLQLPGPGFT